MISNDFERDAILQLMEDSGMRWIRERATDYRPSAFYPYNLFTHDHDGRERLCWGGIDSDHSMRSTRYPATDFIGSEFSGEGLTVSEPDNTISIEPSELATLRAEKAELIEALRGIVNAIQNGLELEDIVNAKFIATQTLAKCETK